MSRNRSLRLIALVLPISLFIGVTVQLTADRQHDVIGDLRRINAEMVRLRKEVVGMDAIYRVSTTMRDSVRFPTSTATCTLRVEGKWMAASMEKMSMWRDDTIQVMVIPSRGTAMITRVNPSEPVEDPMAMDVFQDSLLRQFSVISTEMREDAQGEPIRFAVLGPPKGMTSLYNIASLEILYDVTKLRVLGYTIVYATQPIQRIDLMIDTVVTRTARSPRPPTAEILNEEGGLRSPYRNLRIIRPNLDIPPALLGQR